MRMQKIYFPLFILFFSISPLKDGFVYISDINNTIIIDLKYYSNSNFTGHIVDGYNSNKAILSEECANALSNAQEDFEKLGYSLIVYDAYRPQRAVDFFVNWSKDLNDTIHKSIYYPNIKKSKLFELGYIAYKSSHSRGSTVDVSLVNLKTRKELDMGTVFDFFDVESSTFHENISKIQKSNRMLLYETMTNNGFKNYPKEWWHFTLDNEPHVNFFDFLID